jgi:hypothetical protein
MGRTKSELHFSARFEKRENTEDFLKYVHGSYFRMEQKLI